MAFTSICSIYSSSNHAPQIIKQLQNALSERPLKNSSNQEMFNTAKVEYKDALNKWVIMLI